MPYMHNTIPSHWQNSPFCIHEYKYMYLYKLCCKHVNIVNLIVYFVCICVYLPSICPADWSAPSVERPPGHITVSDVNQIAAWLKSKNMKYPQQWISVSLCIRRQPAKTSKKTFTPDQSGCVFINMQQFHLKCFKQENFKILGQDCFVSCFVMCQSIDKSLGILVAQIQSGKHPFVAQF